MKIITLNLNGVENAEERGFSEWLKNCDADIVCVQNLRCKEYQIPQHVLEVPGFEAFFADAEEDDFSGVGIYCRKMPKAVIRGLGFPQCDIEGRFIQADFDNFSICSVLFPYASDDEEQELKFQFMEQFKAHLKKTRRKRREYIFVGTFHMAHRTIDLGNWENHQRNPGFLPEERAWMDQVVGPLGYVDAFRQINKRELQHTWWPFDEAQRFGMRIDYQIITPELAPYIDSARIITEPRLSPHCMLEVDYDLEL
ncbi:exodeoxyribonuclease III [Gynuella sunshinyii]|uniref:Exonuclease III n=1 Tax=Gynuella sunshinyii YC6258 TaxID=1445510 RepID=A0A0C5V0P9_9GAMM|nr:exodeoxyribonuclease III [Gynuella sunshinyii]AJQ93125.1 exonuclease III [Gynuella sunshinyii YC6258]